MRCAAAGFLAFLALPLAAADWLRLNAPGLELLTDAGESAGRATLERLSQIRDNLPAGSAQSSHSLPVRIFLFASEREFRGYAEGPSTDGFFQGGPDRDFIVLYNNARLGRVVGHEYVHLLLNHAASPLPLWFEEGMAEFYSTLEARGNSLVLGAPIAEHRQTLARGRWLTAEELFGATKASTLNDERTRAGLFYAQSWALVHMLNMSKSYRDGMPTFVDLLSEGEAAGAAILKAFGRNPDRVLTEMRQYIGQFAPVRVDGSTSRVSVKTETERISEPGATLARAELALRTSHLDLARDLYTQAARNYPDSPAATAGLAMLAIQDRDSDRAREYLERAVARGGGDAALWFEYAMFARESGPPRAQVDELLRKAVALNPNLAEARFVLGVRATDDRRYEEAIAHLTAAVQVLPRQSSFWHALAFALEQSGRRGEALDAARKAVRTAATPEEDSMARALADSLQEERVR